MKQFALLLLAAAFLAGCAAHEGRLDRASERQAILEAYTTHAGQATQQVLLPRVHAWIPVGQSYIAIRTMGNRYYLLDLDPPCSEAFRPIGITRLTLEQRTPNMLTALDVVRVNGQPCRIISVRPINHEAIYAQLAEQGVRQDFIRVDRS